MPARRALWNTEPPARAASSSRLKFDEVFGHVVLLREVSGFSGGYTTQAGPRELLA